GTLIAADTDRGRLSRLPPRANKAGAKVADTVLLNPGREMDALSPWQGKADLVLIDAPCSGTGTWRRNPESRWRLTSQELARLTHLQGRLLDIAAQLVRPGGRIAYITCSLLDEEGAGQVDSFLARNPGFTPTPLDLPFGAPRGPGMRLTPHHDGTDGFFIASLSAA
ncbi:MAG TPA: RsmB/NOP family class I SAM-dependent RNA methyltransferase, partial [Paracoccaceae bacterium]|nr:RsmB/NOP family class I SAM-dependent RNA methyltransferase [Paracoccaceae bacterium]